MAHATKVFFASDVHGSEKCFKKFVNAGEFYRADVIILGGDLTGKAIVPIVKQADGSYEANFLDSDWRVKSREELETLERSIRYAGFYPYITDPAEVEELNASRAKVEELFSRLMVETMKRWIDIAEERLKGKSIKCYINPGNDDRLEVDRVFAEAKYVINPEGKVVYIDDYHEMISTGYSNCTPWNSPREISEEALAKKIESMTSQVKHMENCIFNFHCPPYNSEIDSAPKLDKNLKPIISSGGQLFIPVGSTAVRAAIEKHQPLLGLHGHIHESRGAVKIGRTLCINPGSEYTEGILRGVLIKIDKGEIKHYQLTSG